MTNPNHDDFMAAALEQASTAQSEGEVPVGKSPKITKTIQIIQIPIKFKAAFMSTTIKLLQLELMQLIKHLMERCMQSLLV